MGKKKRVTKKTLKLGWWFDCILLAAIVALCVVVRIPSLNLDAIVEEYREYFQNEDGDRYLYEMDSYFYARMTLKYAENPALPLVVDISDDPLATVTYTDSPYYVAGFFPAFAAFIWRILSVFGEISIYKILVFLSPIVASLAAVPAYIFVRRRAGIIGACTAGLIAGLNAAFLTMTSFGTFDTDAVLCVLPLTFMCTFIESLQAKVFWKQMAWAVGSGLSFAALAASWASYTVYYYMAVAIFLIVIIYSAIKNRKCLKNLKHLCGGLACVLFYTLGSLVTWGDVNTAVIERVLAVFNIGTATTSDVSVGFPSSSTFVSELQGISLAKGGIKGIFDVTQSGVINRLGGIVIVLVSIVTLVFMIIRLFRKKDESEGYMTIILAVWFIGGTFALVAGIRFIQILALPLSLIVGLGVGMASEFLGRHSLAFSAWVLAIVLVLAPIIGAVNISKTQIPGVDSALEDMAVWVRENTGENAVLASWWDLGYYYQYEARRRTTGDGATTSGRYYYWLGNMLMTDDPDLAAGICQMLAKCGLEASVEADWYNNAMGCEMLKEVLPLDRDEARQVYMEKYGMDESAAEDFLEMTHPDDQEIYMVLTEDMLGKIRAISYYGYWDFTGADLSVDEIPENSMLYMLYTGKGTVGDFTRVYINEDPLGVYSSVVWKLE